MKRGRAKELLELAQNYECNNHEPPRPRRDLQESPLLIGAAELLTPEFMASLAHVFEDSSEEENVESYQTSSTRTKYTTKLRRPLGRSACSELSINCTVPSVTSTLQDEAKSSTIPTADFTELHSVPPLEVLPNAQYDSIDAESFGQEARTPTTSRADFRESQSVKPIEVLPNVQYDDSMHAESLGQESRTPTTSRADFRETPSVQPIEGLPNVQYDDSMHAESLGQESRTPTTSRADFRETPSVQPMEGLSSLQCEESAVQGKIVLTARSIYSPIKSVEYNAVCTPQYEISIETESPVREVHTPTTSSRDMPLYPNDTPVPSPLVDFTEEFDVMSDTLETSNVYTPLESPSMIEQTSVSSVNTNDTCASRKRKSTYKTNPGRKRLRLEHAWADSLRKKLCNSGKAYKSRSGKERMERKMKEPCKCKSKCYSKLSGEEREKIFSNFWKIGDHAQQWDTVAKYATRKEKKRCTTDVNSRRAYSVTYTLPTYSENNTESVINVCKTMFINTLAVTKDFVRTALDKYDGKANKLQGTTDNRGHHKKHKTVVTSEVKRSVIDHVKSFAPIESHYIRKDSNKKYLDNSLSFTRMFEMYKEWYPTKEYTDNAKTLRQYRDIINSEMNVAFFVPKKDQCDVCHTYKNEIEPTPEVKAKHEIHYNNKEYARELKEKDKFEAKSKPETIVTAVFDFQKILNSPHGDISIFYYKRKLSVYNFTVFSMGTLEATCYMWDEQTAKRGANEVASCVFDFFQTHAEKGVKNFRLWSDNCGGQNRNRIVYQMYLYASKNLKIDITHRFLEKGHTQNEGDSVHALIERKSKGRLIYTPDEWYSLVRWAKTSEKPYIVKDITQEQIFDFKAEKKYENWTHNKVGEKVKWKEVKEIHVNTRNKDVVFYKYKLQEEEFMAVECPQKKTMRGKNTTHFNLKKAYNAPIPIDKKKYDDLMLFCKSNIIPAKFHAFYQNFTVGKPMQQEQKKKALKKKQQKNQEAKKKEVVKQKKKQPKKSKNQEAKKKGIVKQKKKQPKKSKIQEEKKEITKQKNKQPKKITRKK